MHMYTITSTCACTHAWPFLGMGGTMPMPRAITYYAIMALNTQTPNSRFRVTNSKFEILKIFIPSHARGVFAGKLLWPTSVPKARFRFSKTGIWFFEICGTLVGHNNFPAKTARACEGTNIFEISNLELATRNLIFGVCLF